MRLEVAFLVLGITLCRGQRAKKKIYIYKINEVVDVDVTKIDCILVSLRYIAP